MTEQYPAGEGQIVHNITNQQIVIPPKPRPTAEMENDASKAIAYLERLTSSSRLNPDLRMDLNDIKNTIKLLRSTVVRMSEEAQANHDKLVEIVKSQRLM